MLNLQPIQGEGGAKLQSQNGRAKLGMIPLQGFFTFPFELCNVAYWEMGRGLSSSKGITLYADTMERKNSGSSKWYGDSVPICSHALFCNCHGPGYIADK